MQHLERLLGKQVVATTPAGSTYRGELCRFGTTGAFWVPGTLNRRGRVEQPLLVITSEMRVVDAESADTEKTQ
jgi:hypothetical protein